MSENIWGHIEYVQHSRREKESSKIRNELSFLKEETSENSDLEFFSRG